MRYPAKCMRMSSATMFWVGFDVGKSSYLPKGAQFEFNKDDHEFLAKISKHNSFGIVGDHVAL